MSRRGTLSAEERIEAVQEYLVAFQQEAHLQTNEDASSEISRPYQEEYIYSVNTSDHSRECS